MGPPEMGVPGPQVVALIAEAAPVPAGETQRAEEKL